MTWSFGYLYASRNDSLKYYLSKILLYFFNNLVRKRRTTVIHGHKDTEYIEFSIQTTLYKLHRLKKLCYTLKGVVLALNRNEETISCRQGIDR